METKATQKIEKAVETAKQTIAKIKFLEKEKKEAIDTIKKFLDEKDADTLLNIKGDMIIGTYNERGGKPKFDVEKFMNEHPKTYKLYLIESEPYKIFLPK